MQTRNFQLDKSGRGLILGKVTMETHQEGIDEGIDEEALTEGGYMSQWRSSLAKNPKI